MSEKATQENIKHGNDARDILLQGSTKLYDTVSTTLGAKGSNVIIKNGFHGEPLITKDGVTVARNVTSNNIMIQGGIDIILRAAEDTNKEAGDGTTTSIVLAHNLFKLGYEKIREERNGIKAFFGFEQKRVNSISFQKGLNRALTSVIKELKRMSSMDFKPYDVAMISANGDEEIARLIAEAFDKVGKDGIISIEQSDTVKSYISNEEGLKIETGLIHDYFATDQEKISATYRNAAIVLIDAELEKANDIFYFVHKAKELEVPLVVMAHDFGQEVINMFLIEKVKNGTPLLLVKAPLYGENRSALINDISKMTGQPVISERSGNLVRLGLKGSDVKKRADASQQFMGSINKIQMNKVSTSIQYDINQEYIDELKLAYKETKDEFINERVAMLTGGVATINVGGYSMTEVVERLDRVEDAVNATKASLVSGIVAGGGIALLSARKVIKSLKFIDNDEKIGADVLYEVLATPASKILSNAQIQFKNYGEYPMWIDSRSGQVTNMILSGIIDPVNVTISALRNAVSVAATLLTSEAYVLNMKQ